MGTSPGASIMMLRDTRDYVAFPKQSGGYRRYWHPLTDPRLRRLLKASFWRLLRLRSRPALRGKSIPVPAARDSEADQVN
jgi:hypothetical protein